MPIAKASPHKGLKAPVMLKSDHETYLYMYHVLICKKDVFKKDLFMILMMKEPKFAKGS